MSESDPEKLRYEGIDYRRNHELGKYAHEGNFLSPEDEQHARRLNNYDTLMIIQSERLGPLQQIKLKADEHKKLHGKYPHDYDEKRVNEAIADVEKEVNKINEAYFPPITSVNDIVKTVAVTTALGLGVGAVIKYWDNIVSAVTTALQTAAVLGASAVGGAALAAGSYIASNWAWEKITGEESPVKAGITAVALFAAVAGGGYHLLTGPSSGQAAGNGSTRDIADGFYKATKDGARVLEYNGGAKASEFGIGKWMCLNVTEGRDGQEFARVAAPQYFSGDYRPDSVFWMRKSDLQPAPECKVS